MHGAIRRRNAGAGRYHPGFRDRAFDAFAQPIKNPVYTIDDPAFVKSDAPVPATMSGYSSVGFPSIVVPMGFGSQGLPMTITFFGKPYDEKKIIGFAYAYEQASKMREPSKLVPPLEGESLNYATK